MTEQPTAYPDGAGVATNEVPPMFRAEPPQPTPMQAPVYVKPAVMDLDKLERENPSVPFDFVHGGKRYLMSDPQEVDWQDLLAALSNPHMFFRYVLPPEDHVEFFSSRMASWKMQALMKRYQDHYGIPSLPNAGGLPR